MKNKKGKQQKFPKPQVIGEIPIVRIDGEVWGLVVSIMSKEEQEFLEKERNINEGLTEKEVSHDKSSS